MSCYDEVRKYKLKQCSCIKQCSVTALISNNKPREHVCISVSVARFQVSKRKEYFRNRMLIPISDSLNIQSTQGFCHLAPSSNVIMLLAFYMQVSKNKFLCFFVHILYSIAIYKNKVQKGKLYKCLFPSRTIVLKDTHGNW